MRNPFEIAKRFRYVGDADERIGELAHQFGELRNLMLVDNADEHAFCPVGIAADGGQNGYAMAQFAQETVGHFFGVRGNDFGANGLLARFEHIVAHTRGDKAIDDAQNDRLDIEVVYEIGQHGDSRVQRENDVDERIFGALFVDVGRDEIGAAGAAAAADGHAVNRAVDYARNDGGEQRALAVARMIDKSRQIELLQKQ